MKLLFRKRSKPLPNVWKRKKAICWNWQWKLHVFVPHWVRFRMLAKKL